MGRIITVVLMILAFSLNALSQSKLDFFKKWNFEGYIYLGVHFPPEENEKSDYLTFKQDGTFTIVDEGNIEHGTWEWKSESKSIYFYDAQSKLPFILEVTEVSDSGLILLLKDEEDSIKLKFSAEE